MQLRRKKCPVASTYKINIQTPFWHQQSTCWSFWHRLIRPNTMTTSGSAANSTATMPVPSRQRLNGPNVKSTSGWTAICSQFVICSRHAGHSYHPFGTCRNLKYFWTNGLELTQRTGKIFTARSYYHGKTSRRALIGGTSKQPAVGRAPAVVRATSPAVPVTSQQLAVLLSHVDVQLPLPCFLYQ